MKSTQEDGSRHQIDHLKLIKTLTVKLFPLSYKVNPTYQAVRGMRQSLQCLVSVLYFTSEVPKANECDSLLLCLKQKRFQCHLRRVCDEKKYLQLYRSKGERASIVRLCHPTARQLDKIVFHYKEALLAIFA